MKDLRTILRLPMMALLVAVCPFASVTADSHSDYHMYSQPEEQLVGIASGNPNFSILARLVTEAGLVEALSGEGPFTLFAPLNSAFRDLGEDTINSLLDDTDALREILLYHVVPGTVLSSDLEDGLTAQTLQGSDVTFSLDPVRVNDANVVTADILALNGVIHIIDQVLIPPAEDKDPYYEDDTSEDHSVLSSHRGKDVVEILVGNPNFSILVHLVTKAGLVDTLQGAGPFTVFAPLNSAFRALGEDTINALLDDIDTLTEILLYHVLPGAAKSTDLSDGLMATTVQGTAVTVSLDPIMINNANVITADVKAKNGIIHVIDTVLIPGSNTGDGDAYSEKEITYDDDEYYSSYSSSSSSYSSGKSKGKSSGGKSGKSSSSSGKGKSGKSGSYYSSSSSSSSSYSRRGRRLRNNPSTGAP